MTSETWAVWRRGAWRSWCGAFRCVGLTAADGEPSFSKLVTVAVLAIAVSTGTFSLGIAILVIAASFGRATFGQFLSARAVQARELVTVAVNRREPNLYRDDER